MQKNSLKWRRNSNRSSTARVTKLLKKANPIRGILKLIIASFAVLPVFMFFGIEKTDKMIEWPFNDFDI